MALKTVLETLDGLDEAIQPLYVEADGKYVLDVEGVDDHPEVASLRNAYARTKEGREKALQDAAALRAKIAELEKGAPDAAAARAKLTALEERLAEAEAKAGEWQTKYVGVTRDQSLASALTQAGITEPAFVKAATAMLSGQVRLAEDGSAYVETAMGPKMLSDFVKTWAGGEGAAFVSKPQGGGARSSEGGSKATPKGNLVGSREDRLAAIKNRFPELE
ncbi:MAG TPA: hypothetical protein ENN65_05200 [Candidatus Hydrogenedentes bacterium]|nr:hypothetical protein [Candidatus Hydrogenedentota bacterium]